MNVNTSRNYPINPALFAAPSVRRRVWTDRHGHLVSDVVTVIPQKASVHWEAYVVDVETNQSVEQFPHMKDTTTLSVSNGGRPTEAIVTQYLSNVRGQVPEDIYHELIKKVSSQTWSVATIIHNTQPMTS